MSPKRIHIQRLWVPVFMMAGICLLSGTAGVQMGGLSFTGIDKVGHLVVFGLLGIAWARALSGESIGDRGRWLAAVALTAGFGFLDELHQYTNPSRFFEWGDLLADFLGACLGAGVYLRMHPLRRWMEYRVSLPRLKGGR